MRGRIGHVTVSLDESYGSRLEVSTKADVLRRLRGRQWPRSEEIRRQIQSESDDTTPTKSRRIEIEEERRRTLYMH